MHRFPSARLRGLVVALAVFAALALVALPPLSAQEGQEATLTVSEEGTYGPHLATAEGMSLYLYTEDAEGSSACTESCTRNWPPLLVEGEPVAAEGLDADLLGTLEREDGTTQVTYAGHPLYSYVRDSASADTNGQGLGGRFFLVSPAGERITEEVAQEAPDIAEETFTALMDEGGRGFANNCAACHGNEGQGQIGPRLAGNGNLESGDFVAGRILNGFEEHGMPPFRDQLDDRQVAAIATYVRNAWGNEFGPVTEEEVSALR